MVCNKIYRGGKRNIENHLKSKIHLKNVQNLNLDFQIQKIIDNIIAEYITEKLIPLDYITSIKYLINYLVDINFISYDSNVKIKGRDSIIIIINNSHFIEIKIIISIPSMLFSF